MSKNGLALILTLFLIALIILTSPSSSLTLFLSGLSGSYTKGSIIDFSIEANISSSEHIPVNFIQLNITGNSSYSCKIYMNGTVEGCSFLTVKSIEYDSYGYGYGYGYDYGYHYLGYGYGYGPSKIRINLSLDTLALEGSYTARAMLNAGYGSDVWEFSSPVYSFTVFKPITQPNPSRGGSRYFFEILDQKVDGMSYGIKVKNSGTEELTIYLEVENYTSQPIIVKPGEVVWLNYTFNESGKHRVFVIADIDGRKIIKYVDVDVSGQGMVASNQTMQEQPENETIQPETPQENKRPITGLAVAIDFINKYKLAIILILLFTLAIIAFLKLR